MRPIVDPGKSPDRDELLGRLWDALQESGTLGSKEIDADDVAVITAIHNADDVAPADDDTIQRMWAAINAGVAPQMPAGNGASISLATKPVATTTATGGAPRLMLPERHDRVLAATAWIIRALSVAQLSGFIVGFLVIGGGGRLAMRIAAMLSADELQGSMTENAERVGEITLSGTVGLMFTGAAFGMALGLGFLLIAHLIPASGWRRVLVSGALFFTVCGFVTLERGENADYERFGIAGVNVCIFTLLPLLFGLLIAPLYDWLNRSIPRDLPRFSRSAGSSLVSFLMIVAMLAVVPVISLLLFLPPLQLFLVAPLLALGGERLIARLVTGSARWSLWPSRVALAVPCLTGLTLLLIAVGRIV